MGWFSKRESDPIGDICRLLVEKPWEWEGAGGGALRHLSGVGIGWQNALRDPRYPLTEGAYRAAVVQTAGASVVCSQDETARVKGALLRMAAARVARPRVSFDEATKSVARAVLEGDKEAAYQLADWVMEHCGGTRRDG